jgi:phosphoribosylaminoimidazolecarboxamide formyltransferase/IMP cyclohydrolase
MEQVADRKIERALISVYDKTGIVSLAKLLQGCSIEILSTGGTAKLLGENGVSVTSVDSYTGSPEIMDGRVKTLHPKIHGGLLAVRDNPVHREQMEKYGIKYIDLVVVNLYPFKQTIAKPGVTVEEAIENIDIGGPTMIRSSAKNHNYVATVVDPADYEEVGLQIKNTRALTNETRKKLAVKAFAHTADYDTAIADYLSSIYGVKI